ncbi:MAG: AraD1 family protein [Runella sp.]
MRIVQLINRSHQRRIAVVEEPYLRLLKDFENVYTLADQVITKQMALKKFVEERLSTIRIDYDEVYHQKSDWRLLCPIDHPTDPRYCMVTGTGLTHKASADNRQKMNEAKANNQLTDSIRMYQWGEEGGKPEKGKIGVQPEWFYKGNGSVLKGIYEPLLLPNFGNDGGEEPEVAAIYLNDHTGTPHRIGFATGNEFSDHVMEKKNYLYLAHSKIRTCSLGPELVITDTFDDISGEVAIVRKGEIIWKKNIKTGEANMAHSLQNLEYHHFKHPNHRLPHDLHVHYFGTGAFSFGDGLRLEEGDLMSVFWQGMGRPLVNPLKIDTTPEQMLTIKAL